MNIKRCFIWLLIVSFFQCPNLSAYPENNLIKIPDQFGSVIHRFKGTNGPSIILIQDAHAQYEAQIQIKNILNDLIQNHSIQLIGLEGGSGPLHPEYFDLFEDKRINYKIADRLVQEGELSGAEYAAIQNPSIQWIGLENINLYRNNLIQFKKSHQYSEFYLKKLQKKKTEIAKLKSQFFSRELLKFDAKRNRYQEKQNELQGYLKYLEKKSGHKFNLKEKGIEQFFEEVRLLENQIYSNLAKTSQEKALLEQSKKLELAEKLTKLQLSSFEFKELGKTSFEPAQKFYIHAQKRNEALTDNLLKVANGNQKIVLISGGFHISGIETLLRKRKISYLTIIPKFNAVKSNYLKVILNNKIAPTLLTNDRRAYRALNRLNPERQRKIIAQSYLRFLTHKPNLKNPYFASYASSLGNKKTERIAKLIFTSFKRYKAEFEEITARAQSNFETCNWKQTLEDAQIRIRMYRLSLDVIVDEIQKNLKKRTKDLKLWEEIKKIFLQMESEEYDSDLALTYFYSVQRRMHLDNGISIEYTDDGIKRDPQVIKTPYKKYPVEDMLLNETVKRILIDRGFKCNFEDLNRDAEAAGERIEEKLKQITGSKDFDSIEILNSTFYRNKGAYVVGRIRKEGRVIPLVMALLNSEQGIAVDAVLLDEKYVSNVFSYTRSNFHVDITDYRELADFLESTMPEKGRAAIYSAIGFIHPGKIELIRELRTHIRKSDEKFEITEGSKGAVMLAFTRPSFPYVFKIIADKMEKEGAIKSSVKNKYQMVHESDRSGYMLDAMTYRNLAFDLDLFTPEVLDEIKNRAPEEYKIINRDGAERIIIKNIYVKRKVVPLDIYIKEHEHDEGEIRRVLEEWGLCIKGLAATGFWVGDFKAANFGITSTGRVVSFDYDELRPLCSLNFERRPRRHMAPDIDSNYMAPGTAWHDKWRLNIIYLPDEFGDLQIPSRWEKEFERINPELFNVDYLEKIQTELREGKLPDVFPYPASERLRNKSFSPKIPSQSGEGHSLGLNDKLESMLTLLGLKQSA